ncbi:tyrosine-type recombinase/integrase [Halegenticoccus soli]|uniref:tyrosine-type recombinase/integrase n=1 Tax=Halegenticoccus soli TaxID=1985678 RepID=UPI000C6D34AD|nr:site-specific integrase [Halegenticoccus soli]
MVDSTQDSEEPDRGRRQTRRGSRSDRNSERFDDVRGNSSATPTETSGSNRDGDADVPSTDLDGENAVSPTDLDGSAASSSDLDGGDAVSSSDLDEAIRARVESIDSGNYRRSTEHVLTLFRDWLRRERGVDRLADVEVLDCRRYAQWLRRRANDDDDPLSASSAAADGPYFTVVRAFFEWCVQDERLDANPAKPRRVTDALPETHGTRARQFWSVEDREAILAHVDERAAASLDGDRSDRLLAFRDRALVYTLALTGVRGAEVFRDPGDDRRRGLRWDDVDFDRGLLRVFGKSREFEWAQLPRDAADRLRRYRRALDPPRGDWPVFPTAHAPSLYACVREGLAEAGWSDRRIEAALDAADPGELIREHGLVPNSVSTNGARAIMRRLCEAAEVDIDGDYLKPHGARRGLGNQLYAEGSAELAQDVLRHKSVETTHRAYRDERTVETRRRVERVLDRTPSDGRER